MSYDCSRAEQDKREKRKKYITVEGNYSVDNWQKVYDAQEDADKAAAAEEMEENHDTDKETIISNWIEAEIQRIEVTIGLDLFAGKKVKQTVAFRAALSLTTCCAYKYVQGGVANENKSMD